MCDVDGDGSDDSIEVSFGSLHVVLRDCCCDPSECHEYLFDEEPTDGGGGAGAVSQAQLGAIQARNLVREETLQNFQGVRTWCLPPLPWTVEDAREAALSSRYTSTLEQMRSSMGEQLETPKLLNGDELTGKRLAKLAQTVAGAVSKGEISTPPNLIEAACDAEALALAKTVLETAKRMPTWYDAFDELAGDINVLPASIAKAKAALHEWRLAEEAKKPKRR